MTNIKNVLAIDKDGTKFWYKGNVLHRDGDLPAIEWSNGTKEWYKNDLLHRDNYLSAIIHANGIEEYWENGKQITQEESLYRALHKNLPESSVKSSIKKYKG